MGLPAFKKYPERSSHLFPKRFREGAAGHDVRTTVKEKADELRFPGKQNICEWNGPGISAVFHQKLNEILTPHGCGIGESLIFYRLVAFVPGNELHQTMVT
jgi:hypothetical protein